MKKNIAQTVAEAVEPYAKQLQLELYDVEYLKEGADWFLRIYIDKPDGVSSDDCEKMSRLIDPVLDELDPIENSYYLEVSSVGLDKPIKTEKDFNRFMNSKVDVKLYKALNGAKELLGTLCEYNDGEFGIELSNGETVKISVKDAALIRPHIEF